MKTNNTQLIMDREFTTGGNFVELEGTSIKVLLHLLASTNLEGQILIKENELTEAVGVGNRTIEKHIQKLIGLGWISNRINKVEVGGYKTIDVYTLNKIPGISIVDTEGNKILPAPLQTGIKSTLTKDEIFYYFRKKYKEHYGHGYSIDFSSAEYVKIISYIKYTTIPKYDNELILNAIDVLFREYEAFWSSGGFNTLNSSILCTHIFEICMRVAHFEKVNHGNVGRPDIVRMIREGV